MDDPYPKRTLITPSLSYHWRYRGFPLNSVFLEASEVTKDSEILEISEVSRWLGGLEVSDNSKVVEVSEAENVSVDTFSYILLSFIQSLFHNFLLTY